MPDCMIIKCESLVQLTFKARDSGPLIIDNLDFIFEDPYTAANISIEYFFNEISNAVNYQESFSIKESGHWKFGRIILDRNHTLTVKFKNSELAKSCIGYEATLWQL